MRTNNEQKIKLRITERKLREERQKGRFQLIVKIKHKRIFGVRLKSNNFRKKKSTVILLLKVMFIVNSMVLPVFTLHHKICEK